MGLEIWIYDTPEGTCWGNKELMRSWVGKVTITLVSVWIANKYTLHASLPNRV